MGKRKFIYLLIKKIFSKLKNVVDTFICHIIEGALWFDFAPGPVTALVGVNYLRGRTAIGIIHFLISFHYPSSCENFQNTEHSLISI